MCVSSWLARLLSLSPSLKRDAGILKVTDSWKDSGESCMKQNGARWPAKDPWAREPTLSSPEEPNELERATAEILHA